MRIYKLPVSLALQATNNLRQTLNKNHIGFRPQPSLGTALRALHAFPSSLPLTMTVPNGTKAGKPVLFL